MTASEAERILTKIATWMEKQAAKNESDAASCRFISLREAYIYDAKNLRAMAKDARDAINHDAAQRMEAEDGA